MEHKQDVCALYRRGLSIRQIAEMTGLPQSTVAYRVRPTGLMRDRSAGQIAGGRRKTALPFEWSFLPMTVGKPGSLVLSMRVVTFGGNAQDFFSPAATATRSRMRTHSWGGKLHVVSFSYGWTVSVNSVRLCAELKEAFGLAPDTAAARTFPRLGSAILPHFVRGVLDSGAAAAVPTGPTSAPWRCAFIAQSSVFVKQLRQTVDTQTGTHGDIGSSHMPRANEAWSLHYTGKDAITVGHWLYHDSTPAIRCERGYQTYQAWAARA